MILSPLILQSWWICSSNGQVYLDGKTTSTNPEAQPSPLRLAVDQNDTRSPHFELMAVAYTVARAVGFVNVQVLSEGLINATLSWICNVRPIVGVLASTVFIAADEAAFAALRKVPDVRVVRALDDGRRKSAENVVLFS